jgi:glucosamine kinase
MIKTFLIADSGGTQTDWCFVNEQGDKCFFTTSSFHPSHWNEMFFNEFLIFWNSNPEYKKAFVHFYGAGCLNQNNKIIISEYFEKWGFTDFVIHSDVEGACHSLLGNESGTIGILGTGSVVCEYDGEKITHLKGGFGYLLGDEGSGYYFGKLLLSAYLNGEFSEIASQNIQKILGNRDAIISNTYGIKGKSYISSIAKIIGENNQDISEIELIHSENFQRFISKYLVNNTKNQHISIIGSYGFYNQETLLKVLKLNNIELKQIIQFPIKSLTDYVINHTL